MYSSGNSSVLECLDYGISSYEQVEKVKKVLEKLEKSRIAVSKGINLGDVLHDVENINVFSNLFGDEYDTGIHFFMRLSLEGYNSSSFTINANIDGKAKMDYFYRAIGGWKNFNISICFHDTCILGPESIRVINPVRQHHWERLGYISSGTVVTVFVKSVAPNGAKTQELLALERSRFVFESVQNFSDKWDANSNSREVEKKKKKKKKILRKSSYVALNDYKLIKTLRFVVSKIDTFIHAGNARLIINHLRGYKGKVKMYVIRGEKEPVLLDADSIWGMEIRNGESVFYEFYGAEEPAEGFLKELILNTNKYTQNDKMCE